MGTGRARRSGLPAVDPRCLAAVQPFSTDGNYINFQTSDEDAARVRASYGGNYERLAAIKQRYNPANLFRTNRNIGW